jgi:hypothetical protein
LHIKYCLGLYRILPIYGRQSEVLGFNQNLIPCKEKDEEYKFSVIDSMSNAAITSFKQSFLPSSFLSASEASFAVRKTWLEPY